MKIIKREMNNSEIKIFNSPEGNTSIEVKLEIIRSENN